MRGTDLFSPTAILKRKDWNTHYVPFRSTSVQRLSSTLNGTRIGFNQLHVYLPAVACQYFCSDKIKNGEEVTAFQVSKETVGGGKHLVPPRTSDDKKKNKSGFTSFHQSCGGCRWRSLHGSAGFIPDAEMSSIIKESRSGSAAVAMVPEAAGTHLQAP